ncbi:alpha-glucosidase [Aureobasidium subglaciale]|nr:alpha-glucosidase [Aureobasidium subglaciale]KAI5213496.1 alpha-glucosidase [Aureobasidium subglaciale]
MKEKRALSCTPIPIRDPMKTFSKHFAGPRSRPPRHTRHPLFQPRSPSWIPWSRQYHSKRTIKKIPELGLAKSERAWWKYFLSRTNGDGYGDVKGITSRLDYLKDLGTCLKASFGTLPYLHTVYKSPQVDMGYDISHYNDIDPMYGLLADVDELIAQLGKRDMKLMTDVVVNHTLNEVSFFENFSDSHPVCFIYRQSQAKLVLWKKDTIDSRGKRRPPNNWCRTLNTTGRDWESDETTEEYYLPLFSAEQSDLNWDNPDVRSAVRDILRFRLDRGAAGFRMDVIAHILRLVLPTWQQVLRQWPQVEDLLQEMRQVLDEYNTITVVEMPFIHDEDEITENVGMQGSLNMVFLFRLLNMDNEPGQSKWSYHEWDATDMKRIHELTQRLMIDRSGWNAIFVENHDGPRSTSRFADDSDKWRERVYGAQSFRRAEINAGQEAGNEKRD